MAETITQITQPPEFIEAAAKPYITQLQQDVGGLRTADLSKVYGPQFVAGQDPLQQAAVTTATGAAIAAAAISNSLIFNGAPLRAVVKLHIPVGYVEI